MAAPTEPRIGGSEGAATSRSAEEDEDEEGPPIDVVTFVSIMGAYVLLENLVAHPYDVIKTRQQVAAPTSRIAGASTGATARRIIRKEGPLALYRGFGCATVGGVPEVCSYLWYNQLKRTLLATPWGEEHPGTVYLVAGLVADSAGVLLGVPFENVAQRVMLQTTAMPDPGFRVAADIVRRDGVLRGLWRGSAVSLMSHAPSTAIWWWAHETGKPLIARLFGLPDPNYLAVHVTSGTLAGVAATVATNPLDVIKTRIQTAPKPEPALAMLRGLVRDYGWRRAWLLGLVPRCCSFVPRSILQVIAYESALAAANLE